MQTAVIMKRELFGSEISQNSKNLFFSATDLVKAGNVWRSSNKMPLFNMSEWLRNDSTIEFMKELEKQFPIIKVSGRGRGSHTWVHPLLFIDMALAISPTLKVEVYKWLYDNLIGFRNESGDSYKEMCGALFVHSKRKDMFAKNITELVIRIKHSCNVKGDWEHATEAQLALRDTMHKNIKLIANLTRDNNTAINCGIKAALDDVKSK